MTSRLSFRQLQVFKAVYELQSYSKAGDLLGLTQPAVSSQIRQLEQGLDQPLFEYVGRRLFYTAAGERLYESINAIFIELSDLQTDLGAIKGHVSGELKLVALNTCQYIVPFMLKAFLALPRQVSARIQVVNRETSVKRSKWHK